MAQQIVQRRPCGRKPTPILERFWSKVRKSDGCWEWTGPFNNRGGHGLFYAAKSQPPLFQRMTLGAHRFSWLIHRGYIPDGLLVCHHCDNPKCVRPDHLFLGTDADNVHDSMRKGRGFVGEMNGRAIFTAAQVREIRAAYVRGKWGSGQLALAKRYGVDASTIRSIVNRVNWKDV